MPSVAAAEGISALRSTPDVLRELLPSSRRLAERLVLLEEVPAAEILAGVDRVQRALEEHAERADPLLAALDGHRLPGRVPPELLRDEHRIYPESVRQLRWFLDIVLRDDHGGNRQALGQFWTLLSESLHHHLEDEGAYLDAVGAGPAGRRRTRGPGSARDEGAPSSAVGAGGPRTDR